MATDKLSKYKQKRDFKLTAEPSGEAAINPSNRRRFYHPEARRYPPAL
jgi:bifunctional non-homologous end joining protein LigD